MQSRHYLLSGRVQGVGFRQFTYRRAKELGLRGWVRNLLDGRVEVLVAGSDDKLIEFEDVVSRGPQHARVDNFEKAILHRDLSETRFHITEDGESPWDEGF